MRKTYRVLAIILAIIMLTALFTGCNKNAGETATTEPIVATTNKQDKTQDNENLNEDETSKGKEDNEGEIVIPGNLEGLDSTIQGLQRPVSEPVDLKRREILIVVPQAISYMYPIEGNTKLDDVKIARAKVAEQKFNCSIKWEVYIGDFFKNLMNNALAGTQWGDIVATFRTTSYDIASLVKKNIFYELDDYIDFTDPFYSLPHMQAGIYNGKHYGFKESAMTFSNLMLYNKDILDRDGLPDVFELQQSFSWTWDQLVEIAEEATRDLNGDGIIDEYGLENINGLPTVLLHSNCGDFISRDDGGNFSIAMKEQKTMRAYQFYRDLCNLHKVMSPKTGSAESLFLRGKVALAVGGVSQYIKEHAPENSGFVMFPRGPDADRYMGLTYGGPIWTIPTYVKDPKSIALLMAEIFSLWDLNDVNSLNLSDALIDPIRVNMFSDRDLETFKLYLENMSMPQYANFYGVYLNVTQPLFRSMQQSNDPVISVVETYATQAQAALDEIMK